MDDDSQVVGIAEITVAQSPQRLMAYGLGSCVGVTLYDVKTKTGGMAHVMLPSSRLRPLATPLGKYADTALGVLAAEVEKAGGRREKLEAKIVGGANMFEGLPQNVAAPIGLRNVAAVRQKLGELGIPIVGEQVGGNRGRTMIFNLEDGRVEIRMLNQPAQYL